MKRSQDPEALVKAAKTEADAAPQTHEASEPAVDAEMGEFEDPYGDEFESEDEVFEAGADGEPPVDDDAAASAAPAAAKRQVYVPQRSGPLAENEVMEADYSVYHMLHNVNVAWPCLSFDIIPDSLGNERTSYPQSMYLVTGTQAKRAKDNEIVVMKLSSLGKTMIKDEDDEDEDEEEDEDDGYDADPVLENKLLPTNSTTNRVRVTPFAASTGEALTATMAEDGVVHVWDLSKHVRAFDTPGTVLSPADNKPVHSIKAHGRTEGYGLDWSPLVQSGALLSGDMDGKIFHTSRTTSGWVTEAKPFTATTKGSVEDIQWSPVERTVFASAGGDGHVHIWDTRQQTRKPALSVAASTVDVNVMSWNRKSTHLLATGADDGKWAVWDLRNFSSQKPEPVAAFGYHQAPITSLEFHPNDESVVAVGSEDSTVTLWDLAVEADDEEVAAQRAGGDLDGVPPQLLFVHWQPHVKELHWHKQIPGTLVSTGSEGFSMWRTISV